ncbi:MAG: hypothetical protein CO108_09425 [Deltaproteobacteria bacterium CG_4_9_14_3_um_filter_63_12]|nr:MAG: hypothetical protein COW42_03460 [Deltaproteobacteria bacterium CG17_big_fil_post_rev_8_21_14_2_50_63_7]PJB43981.1 MAG: hypothetical protein CO108_09425 [Deltaproteobacteria bacterium CG_4_9_14_3_um_filter_63_12]
MTVSRRLHCDYKGFLLILGAFLTLLVLPSLAAADEAQGYREQISQYNQKVVKLRASENAAQMTADLNQTQSWLDEALVQVGKEEYNAVKALLRRAEVQLDYIEMELELSQMKAKADAKEAEFMEVQTRAGQLSNELDELTAKEALLQNQVSGKANGK